jgi:glycosyltransferase involved in cell wall biosynthesis
MSENYFSEKNNFIKWQHVPSELIYENKENIKPKYSICIPTYKRSDTLEQALICSIGQNYTNYEIIVVDNDPEPSPDKIEQLKIYKNCQISYYKNHQNLGMFGNWNRCIELAKGEYIVLLHDDDLIDFNFLTCVDRIQIKKNPDMILCDHRAVESDGTIRIVRNGFLKKIWTLIRRYFDQRVVRVTLNDYFYTYLSGTNGGVFRKSMAIKAGGFNEDYYPTADYVFYSKLVSMGISYYSFRQLASYRIGINETLKENLHTRFVENDYYFRNFLYAEFFKSSWIKGVCLKPLIVSHASILASVWKINVSDIISKTQFPVGWISQLTLVQIFMRFVVVFQSIRRLLQSEKVSS